MKIATEHIEESIIKRGDVHYLSGSHFDSGLLILTNNRFYFKCNTYDFMLLNPKVIDCRQWQIPFIKNAILLLQHDTKKYIFIVKKSDTWYRHIMDTLSKIIESND